MRAAPMTLPTEPIGGDLDSTHSADVDYAELLPSLFELQAGNFHAAKALGVG